MSSSAPPATRYLLFVACAPGLESLLEEELAEYDLNGKACAGGVELRASIFDLWALCRRSRLAESVRVRLKPFVARDFTTLSQELTRLPWRAYIPARGVVDVRVTCHKSRLWHSDAVGERVQAVVRDCVKGDPSGEAEALRVYVRIVRDLVQVSVDAGGERLHRRGYRTHVAEASLRETLAAALARLAIRNAPKADALWDPFCGAGTLALEWLESKLGRSPGARRRFAFESWPTHDAARYRTWVEGQEREEASRAIVSHGLCAVGSDISARALRAAQANAKSASLDSHSSWMLGDFEQAESQVPRGALVLSNPPYGVRVTNREDGGLLLDRFGRLLANRSDLRPVILLVPTGVRLRTSGGSRARELLRTSNGGLPVSVQLLS